ncbi:hypothetical protein KI387_029405, partial [Taxus chinensis]
TVFLEFWRFSKKCHRGKLECKAIFFVVRAWGGLQCAKDYGEHEPDKFGERVGVIEWDGSWRAREWSWSEVGNNKEIEKLIMRGVRRAPGVMAKLVRVRMSRDVGTWRREERRQDGEMGGDGGRNLVGSVEDGVSVEVLRTELVLGGRMELALGGRMESAKGVGGEQGRDVFNIYIFFVFLQDPIQGGYMVAFAGLDFAAISFPQFVLGFDKGRLIDFFWKSYGCKECKE